MGYTPDYLVRAQVVTKIRDKIIANLRRLLTTDPKYTYVELPNGEYDFQNTKVIISDVFPQDHAFYPCIVINTTSSAEDRYIGPDTNQLVKNGNILGHDITASIFFDVTQVTDGTHLIISSTRGMNPGDTIVQGTHTTAITTVTDRTHLVVADTTGWVVTNGVTGDLIFDSFVSAVNINVYTIDDSIQRDEICDLLYNNFKYTNTDLAEFGIEIIRTSFPTFASNYAEGRWYFVGNLTMDLYSEWNGSLGSGTTLTQTNVSVTLGE